MIPVPLRHLLPVHPDLVTHLDALLDVPLEWVDLKLVHKKLHLTVVLALTAPIERELQAFGGCFHVCAFPFNIIKRFISRNQLRSIVIRVERDVPCHGCIVSLVFSWG